MGEIDMNKILASLLTIKGWNGTVVQIAQVQILTLPLTNSVTLGLSFLFCKTMIIIVPAS